jgi:hypothetical protein
MAEDTLPGSSLVRHLRAVLGDARPMHGMARIVELADADGTSVVCAPGAMMRHLLVTLAEDAGLDVREYPAR